ncbi:hypothetical protein AAVH_17360 [Aphelenchoides avenae]|nr:hypothetical protein AAVH_17360 [Aphelenchus avenae]
MRDSKPLAAVIYYALLVLMVLAFLVDFYVVCSFMLLEVRISATSWLIHFVFTAVGYTANAFVLIGVVGNKKMRSSPAASDFTYIITNDRIGIHDWPPWMVNRLWGFASYMCPVNRYVSSAAFMASIGTFVAIAVER